MKVGITGGIGSGKTTVCKIFESIGAPVYYADERAKYLLGTDPLILSGLEELFGKEVLGEDGKPDRSAIAGVVFNDSEKLKKLNRLIHPRVGEDWANWYRERAAHFPYVLKEAALLFESGSYKNLDRLICVAAPEKIRIERVVRRDGVTPEQVESRMRNQLSQELKMALSEHLIKNDGSLSLVKQVVILHRLFCRLSETED